MEQPAQSAQPMSSNLIQPIPAETAKYGEQPRQVGVFATTPEELAQLLDVAQVVGIRAEAISDPDEADKAYQQMAYEEATAAGLEAASPTRARKIIPAAWGATAREKVAAGETYVRFTTSRSQGWMSPFYRELERRRQATENPRLVQE